MFLFNRYHVLCGYLLFSVTMNVCAQEKSIQKKPTIDTVADTLGVPRLTTIKQLYADPGVAGTKIKNYICSGNVVKDAVVAYVLWGGLNVGHNLGHSLAEKWFFGSAVKIQFGSSSSSLTPYISLQGITIVGFNLFPGIRSAEKENIATVLSGWLVGMLGSVGPDLVLRRYPGLPITKLVAKAVALNHTIGTDGVGGLLVSNSDADKLKTMIQQWWSKTS